MGSHTNAAFLNHWQRFLVVPLLASVVGLFSPLVVLVIVLLAYVILFEPHRLEWSYDQGTRVAI